MNRSPRRATAIAVDGSRSAPRLHDTIARSIGVRIAAEEPLPGEMLSGEIEALEQLDVSRTAYREAVRIMAAKGMVESRTKTGTRVSQPARAGISSTRKRSAGFLRRNRASRSCTICSSFA